MAQNRLIQKLFENRGLTLDVFSKFENSEHGLPLNVDELCRRLHKYQESGETVTVLTDFDMDGIMSCVIAMAALNEMGIHAAAYVPDATKGYGFDASTIDDCLRIVPFTKAILTGDVGVACFGGVNRCRDLGIEVLVTDHHKPQAVLPDADCLVNPMRADDVYEHPEICGAYVMYQCMQRYADIYCSVQKREQVRRLRMFAGIGTVSDYMPVLYENRQLLRDSISICRMVYSEGSDFFVDLIGQTAGVSRCYYQVFKGFNAVLDKLKREGKITSSDSIDEQLFGYYIAPMFNSVKRIGTWDDMRRLYGIFFGPPACTASIVDWLYGLNEKRKQMVADYMDDVRTRSQPYKPYVYLTDAPAGICGLLAQSLSASSGMPVCVVREDDTIHGSGRSPSWYPFLTQTKGKAWCAGHEGAFGVGFKDFDQIEKLCSFLNADVQSVLNTLPEDICEDKPAFVIACDGSGDTDIDILLFMEYLEELKQYRPFGKGFPAPEAELRFYPSDGEWSTLSDGKHLKITLPHGFEVLSWNRAGEIRRHDGLDIVRMRGRLEENSYKGTYRVQFVGDFI